MPKSLHFTNFTNKQMSIMIKHIFHKKLDYSSYTPMIMSHKKLDHSHDYVSQKIGSLDVEIAIHHDYVKYFCYNKNTF